MTPREIILACPADHARRSEVHLGGRGPGQVVLCCSDCFNAAVYQRRADRKAQREKEMDEGRAYWAGRGIAIGEKVRAFARSMLGFGGATFYGVARVGCGGAYVSSPCEPGRKLCPSQWHKLE